MFFENILFLPKEADLSVCALMRETGDCIVLQEGDLEQKIGNVNCAFEL